MVRSTVHLTLRLQCIEVAEPTDQNRLGTAWPHPIAEPLQYAIAMLSAQLSGPIVMVTGTGSLVYSAPTLQNLGTEL